MIPATPPTPSPVLSARPLLLGLALLPALALAELRVDEGEETLRVMRGELLVSEYRSDWRLPYLYPLLSPSGANLTRHWPIDDSFPEEARDHPHHRSFWFAHGAVNGYDFWSFRGDGEPVIRHLGVVGHSGEEAGGASFTVDLEWVAGGEVLLKERREHRFHDADERTRVIEVSSTLEAVADEVVLGDTKEGTFALRFDRTLRQSGPQARGSILNSEGDEDGAVWSKRARWVAYHGPDERGEAAVIAMLDHPSNLRHPTWWHARDYGLAAANPFGIHDFEPDRERGAGDHTLRQGETLTLRYQVILRHGEIDAAEVEAWWQAFAAP